MNSASGFFILQNQAGQFYAFGGTFYGYSKVIVEKLAREMNETKAENERLKELLKTAKLQDADLVLVKQIMEL